MAFVDSVFKRDDSANEEASKYLSKGVLSEFEPTVIHAHSAIPLKVLSNAVRNTFQREISIILTMHGWGMNKTPDMEIHDIGVMNKLSKVVALNGTDRELLVGKVEGRESSSYS